MSRILAEIENKHNGRTSIIEDGIGLFEIDTQEQGSKSIALEVEMSTILFLFPGENGLKVECSVDGNMLNCNSRQYLMLAYPFQNWSITHIDSVGMNLRGIALGLPTLHKLLDSPLLGDPEVFESALKNFKIKSHFTRKDFYSRIQVLIYQLFSADNDGLAYRISVKGKIMEFLAHFMDPSVGASGPEAGCPYIRDNIDVEKIRKAESIIVDSMQSPPTIKELARQVGTNELKLKTGFKHLYGNTIYGYLMDHRMNAARLLLDRDSLLIKEVAEQVGYSSSSHFILAFKNKFGVTPKKYLKA